VNRTFAPIAALVDELVRCGLRQAVTSPGSRNAPLILALAEREEIQTVSVIDERAAGFVALGMARATGRPVAVTCTSGTAAANLHPAVAEAHQASAPLLVLTADRPPELRDVGAGQSIDQLGLYGSAAKWFVEVGSHEPSRATAIHHRALGCRAWFTCAGGRPGPVHLNFSLRGPLAPEPGQVDAAEWEGRPDGRPWTRLDGSTGAPDPRVVEELGDRLSGVAHGALVCGATPAPVADAVTELARALGWPVLADPVSGVRCGPHDRANVVAHYDVLARVDAFTARHRPELVLRVGEPPVSQSLRCWLEPVPQLVLDPHGTWHDPSRRAERLVAGDPEPLLAALAESCRPAPDPAWLDAWRAADALVPGALAAVGEPFEGAAASVIGAALPDDALVWLSYSMPVRDVEAYLASSPKPLTFLAGHGANGIDGVVSSAAGAAIATGRPTCLLTGDVALVHDAGGLMAARRAGVELRILCLNNDGGGIFDFLPVARHADAAMYERHIATPHRTDLSQLATLAGLEHRVVATAGEAAAAFASPGLVELRTERAANVAAHGAVLDNLAATLSRQQRQ